MKLLATFALGLLALSCGSSSGGGGSAPIAEADACASAATAACKRIFSCNDAQLQIVQLIFMGDETMCEATVLQNCGATGFMCSAGQTYHADVAGQCRDDFNKQSCAALATDISSATSFSPAAVLASLTAQVPACAQICTGAADAATD